LHFRALLLVMCFLLLYNACIPFELGCRLRFTGNDILILF